jgi:hypothetical protein
MTRAPARDSVVQASAKANGPAGPRLADELEALVRAFDREARELELANGRHRAGSHAAGPVADAA